MSMLSRTINGVVAGAVGTVAMDLLWYRRYRQDGGDADFRSWEFATSTSSFEEAGAPGKVAQKIATAVGEELPQESAGTATNVMHWLTGAGYGIGHALLHHRRGVLLGGALTGLAAFGNSYAGLGALGIYKPIWQYDGDTLQKDLGAHLVFGAATVLAYSALQGLARSDT